MDTILWELEEETDICLDSIEPVTDIAYAPLKTPPHVFVGIWDGQESELRLGEGQALRSFPIEKLFSTVSLSRETSPAPLRELHRNETARRRRSGGTRA
ncbi:hypothetical protein ACWD4B_11865 [Streptomyces sp. NPDC002536]